MLKQQHVVKHDKGWAVVKGGADKATRILPTQEGAIKYATKVAKNQGSELFVHGRDGRIKERNSFGNDPCPPRG